MEQEELHRLLSQLLPKLSTQMRYALSNIHLAAAAMAPSDRRDQDPHLDAQAAVMDQSYYQLLRLVNNLMLSAQIDREEPLSLADQDIVELVSRQCLESASLAKLLGLELTFRCAAPQHICAVNRAYWEQVVFQLLSNAFKFTPSGGKVAVELKFTAGRVLLTVSDTGCGIEPDLLPTLFSHIASEEQTSALPPHGVGLGLLLCRRIVQGHGGTIMAESRPEQGTVVTVSLPDRQLGKSSAEDHTLNFDSGFNSTLLGLADALPAAAFRLREEE